jgi:hypothetical protein
LSANPINLALRFLLELAALLAMGAWGWRQGEGVVRFILAFGVPLLAAAVWGVFRVPNDPGKAPVVVPGVLRLALELAYFAFAVWALFDIGAQAWGWALGVIVVLHYLVSYDRVGRLLGQGS